MTSHIRPATVSSTGARKRLEHLSDPVFSRTLNTLDQMAAIYEGVLGIRNNQSPLNTREANALDYKKAADAAITRAQEVAQRAHAEIAERMADLSIQAEKNAGIHSELPGSAEIRAALRGMSQKDRDAAILEAVARGDQFLMSAVLHAPSPITTGAVTMPREALMKDFVQRANPTLESEMADLEFALQSVVLASQGFQNGAKKLRDIGAEERAMDGSAAAATARGKLAAAMSGTFDPPADPVAEAA
jgi:hypothetical protein